MVVHDLAAAGHEIDIDRLNCLLAEGGIWSHCAISGVGQEQIGQEFGFSGTTYRLFVTTESRDDATLIAKFEPVDNIRRSVNFRLHNESVLTGSIPAGLGASLDEPHEQGLILLEDIRPADQGDELRGCSLDQANAVIDIVAHLHAATWIRAGVPVPDGAERWMAQPWEQQRWGARVAKVRERYPGLCTEAVAERLVAMHTEVAEAIGGLVEGPVTWIHHDPHLDNVLWRPDGSPVLLDWSGARIAPLAIDVAGLLMSLAMRADAPLGPDQLLIEYVAALGRHGESLGVTEVGRTAALALKLSIRGMVGWAGLVEEEPTEGRNLALRGDSVGRVLAAIRWLESRVESRESRVEGRGSRAGTQTGSDPAHSSQLTAHGYLVLVSTGRCSRSLNVRSDQA